MKSNDRLLKNREYLKSNWDVLDFEVSDQALKKSLPPMEKPIDRTRQLIPLINKEDWKIKPVTLEQAILNRQSRRKYIKEPLTLEELSFLLYATQGVRK